MMKYERSKNDGYIEKIEFLEYQIKNLKQQNKE